MGITERKEREKLELKERILLTAKDLLLAEGYDQLSIRKIAAAIEYSPATIYLYFQDKDEIMHELMNMGFGLMAQSLAEAFQIQDPAKRILKIGEGYVYFGLNNPEWYELMFHSEKPIKHIARCEEHWGHGLSLFEFLIQSCREAISKGQCRSTDPEALALQLWSTVHGLVSLHHAKRLEVVCQSLDNIIPRVLNSILESSFE